MIVAGLTGGIASGKSTVAEIFSELGAAVIDSDRLAREAVARGSPGWQAVVARFGQAVLSADGDIDRRRLADIVFADPAERAALEGIVHPYVRAESDRRIAALRRAGTHAVVILDVPLLFEAGMHAGRGLGAVIVVWVPEEVQRERLMARDRIGADEADRRIRAQMPIERKKALADRVIDNSGSRERTRAQTREVFRWLVEAAARQAGGAGPAGSAR
jgi:dephospho-CoA kinase